MRTDDKPRASADVSQLSLDGSGVKGHGPGRGLVPVGVLQLDIEDKFFFFIFCY